MNRGIKDRSRGVVYIATGSQYIEEAARSARSLRRHHPELPITLFSDQKIGGCCFDECILIAEPMYSMLDKVRHLWRTPYERTLFLDSDTFVTESINELFEMLDYCDLAGSMEAGHGLWYPDYLKIPIALAEINGGVLCFRRSEVVITALRNWYAEYLETAKWLKNYGQSKWMLTNDQPSLRKLIWENREIRVAFLAPEYNALRFFGTHLFGKAKIVHGRGHIERIAEEMNRHRSNRVYLQGAGTLQPFQNVDFFTAVWQFLKILRAFGYYHIWKNLCRLIPGLVRRCFGFQNERLNPCNPDPLAPFYPEAILKVNDNEMLPIVEKS